MAEHNELTVFAHYMYITNSNRPYPKLMLRFVIIAKFTRPKAQQVDG